MQTIDLLKIGEVVYDIAAKYDSDNNSILDTYSTKNYVSLKLAELVGSAPETLDTLNELAEALNKDPNFATTMATELGNKVDKISGKQLSTEDFTTALKTLLESLPDVIATKYVKPANGITKSDLSEDILKSLAKADTAVQDISHKVDVDTYNTDKTTFALKTEIPTSLPASDVSAWAKAASKPVYTASEIGLDKVNNTADIDKPISTAVQTALNSKVSVVLGKQLSTNDYTDEEKAKVATLQSDLATLSATVQDLQGVEDLLSYGILFDSSVADPKCTRIGNPLLHKSLPIQSSYKGCIVKDGVLQYYLDPNDWSKRTPGIVASDSGVSASGGVTAPTEYEDAVLDGSDGDVCVEIPTFYIKCTTNGNITTVRESLYLIDSDYMEIKGMYVDAYRGTVNDSKLRSVVNTSTEFRGGTNSSSYDAYLSTDLFRTQLGKPRTNTSRANGRTYARNAGKELLSYEQYKAVFYWNYVIEYANFNSLAAYNAALTSDGYHQGGLGEGVTTWDWSTWSNYNGNNPITPCGYGNSIGNFTGLKEIVIPTTKVNDSTTVATKTFKMPRWRGFDNPFGDILTNLEGCILNVPKMYIISNKDDYTDSLTGIKYNRMYSSLPTSEGWIKSWQCGKNADMVPKTVGGSSTTYMCDYYWQNSNVNTLLVGGRAGSGSCAGLCAFYAYGGVSYAYANVGLRGVYLR